MPVLRTRWSPSADSCARADSSTSKAEEARSSGGPGAESAAGPLRMAERHRSRAECRHPAVEQAGYAPARGTKHPRTPARRVLQTVDWRTQIAGTAGISS